MSSPHNSSPDNATPDNSTPDNSTPDNATPDNSTPDNSTPDNSTPDNSTPNNSIASPSLPQDSPTLPSPAVSGQPSNTPVSQSQSQPQQQPQPLAPNKPSSNGTSPSSNGMSKEMVGAVIGVGFVIVVLGVVFCCIFLSRKKKRRQGQNYVEPPPPPGSSYYNSGQNPQYPNGTDHVIRMQQQGNGMGPQSGSWAPPNAFTNSADMSSNYNYSINGGLPSPAPGLSLSLSGGTFTYEELASATGGFNNDRIIGQGGFGYVYKGILPSGKEVAVKSLKSGSGQGEREFQAEIDIISRVHHRHLVSLVGYCISGGQRMLVYEFVPNQTLEHYLHGKGAPTMDWPTRMRIALGSAKGLAYLHEDCHPRIIHRDIKASNVLLDNTFEAKVSDFGLAKLTNDNNTHVSTRVMGTFGYLAPEYASTGKLTEKSDVFSFGVMLLEIITGRRPFDHTNATEDSLVDWARPLLSRVLEEDGNIGLGELVDPFLEGKFNNQEMTRMAACAAASIRHSAKKRPKMSQIVRALEGDVSLDDLKDGMMMKPGNNNLNSVSSMSSEYDTMQYNADMIKFRQAIMSSEEFGDSNEVASMTNGRY